MVFGLIQALEHKCVFQAGAGHCVPRPEQCTLAAAELCFPHPLVVPPQASFLLKDILSISTDNHGLSEVEVKSHPSYILFRSSFHSKFSRREAAYTLEGSNMSLL